MKRELLWIGIAALLPFAACDSDDQSTTATPASVTPDMAVAEAEDMAGAPSPSPTVAPSPSPTMPPMPSAASVTVGPGGMLAYAPASVSIAAGGTVNWTWNGDLTHSVTSNIGLFDSGVKVSGSFSHTFPSAGSFPYHCTVHGFIMSGTVIVH
jgi:plastocyanin